MRFLFLWGIVLIIGASKLQGQRTQLTSSRDTTIRLQNDDPIAAALDSLAYLKLFETTRVGSEFGKTWSLGFALS